MNMNRDQIKNLIGVMGLKSEDTVYWFKLLGLNTGRVCGYRYFLTKTGMTEYLQENSHLDDSYFYEFHESRVLNFLN